MFTPRIISCLAICTPLLLAAGPAASNRTSAPRPAQDKPATAQARPAAAQAKSVAAQAKPIAAQPKPVVAQAKPAVAQTTPAAARIELGKCDIQATYNLPAQRFDETAQAIAHATGCFIRYTDQRLMNVPVQPVRGRLTRRQALRVALRGTSLRIVRETPNLMEVKLAAAQ
jgi:hypothetical protein